MQKLYINSSNTSTFEELTSEFCSQSSYKQYHFDNHLGSACLELDERAGIISYEEYHPFGTTSYRAGKGETEVSLKRYKYCGKERDEETGLYYYGARYYAGWLCRFISVDPLQHDYPHYTPYQYAGNKPITYIDLDGLEEAKPWETQEKSNKSTTESKKDTQLEYKWSDGTLNNVKLKVDPFTYTSEVSPVGLTIDTRDYLFYSVTMITGSLEAGGGSFDKQLIRIKLDNNPYFIWGGSSFWLSTGQHSSFDLAAGGSLSVTYGEGVLKLPSQNFKDISKMFENSYANGIDLEIGFLNIAGVNLGAMTFYFEDGTQSQISLMFGVNFGLNIGSPASLSSEYGEGHEVKLLNINYSKTKEDSLNVKKLLNTEKEVW